MTKNYYQKLFEHSILKIGTERATSLNQEKKIFLVNIICFLHLISFIQVIIIGVLFDPRLVSTTSLIGYLIPTIIIFIVFYLQHLGLHIWAKTLIILSSFITCFYFDVYISPNAQIGYFYIFPPVISLCIFNKRWIPLCFLSLSIALFFDIFHFKNGIPYHQIHFSVLFLVLFFIVYFLIDINKKAELKLQKQQKKLEELNEFKSHFFVNLSHEIRTPITLIKGYTTQIDVKGNKENKQKLSIVKNQIQQIEGIINNILNLSKLDANKLHLERSVIEINPFLNKHYADFKVLFENKNILFSLNNNTQDLAVNMDTDLMSKSMTNLLSNALKFTSENGTVAINAYVEDTKETLVIDITDNGIGIPPEDLDAIFERFYQSKNHITKSQGSGIGLSFTQNIIKAHDFDITVTSIPNIKTIFKISIPKAFISKKTTSISENNTTHSIEESQPSETYQQPKINKKAPTILVVDDHEQMRDYLCSVLNTYNVLEAENGEDALEMIKNNTIDLLVTDYMMPVMDGEALVKAIKKQALEMPIIMLTARIDDFAKLKMLRVGVDGYLNKPFVEEELLLTVKNSLKHYHTIIKAQQTLTLEEKESFNNYATTFHKELKAFALKHITDIDFTVQDIADYFNVSQSTLNRKVKSTLGQTPKQIILQIKIEKARELHLKNPNLSKKEIGFSVGMKNTSHLFSKIAEAYGRHYNL